MRSPARLCIVPPFSNAKLLAVLFISETAVIASNLNAKYNTFHFVVPMHRKPRLCGDRLGGQWNLNQAALLL